MIDTKLLYYKFRANRKAIFLLVILLVAHVVFISVYRPFAYNHYAEISDFAIVNIYPSISCIPISYLFFKLIAQQPKFDSAKGKIYLLACIMSGNYLYEGLDIYLGSGDWYDMIGITIGGVFVLLFIFLNLKRTQNNGDVTK